MELAPPDNQDCSARQRQDKGEHAPYGPTGQVDGTCCGGDLTRRKKGRRQQAAWQDQRAQKLLAAAPDGGPPHPADANEPTNAKQQATEEQQADRHKLMSKLGWLGGRWSVKSLTRGCAWIWGRHGSTSPDDTRRKTPADR